MRLLLDEHYDRAIAEELRTHGHDVVAVTERRDLIGISDGALLRGMAAERRAIMTDNWGDFQRELLEAAATGTIHYGVLFTSRSNSDRWLPDQPVRSGPSAADEGVG